MGLIGWYEGVWWYVLVGAVCCAMVVAVFAFVVVDSRQKLDAKSCGKRRCQLQLVVCGKPCSLLHVLHVPALLVLAC